MTCVPPENDEWISSVIIVDKTSEQVPKAQLLKINGLGGVCGGWWTFEWLHFSSALSSVQHIRASASLRLFASRRLSMARGGSPEPLLTLGGSRTKGASGEPAGAARSRNLGDARIFTVPSTFRHFAGMKGGKGPVQPLAETDLWPWPMRVLRPDVDSVECRRDPRSPRGRRAPRPRDLAALPEPPRAHAHGIWTTVSDRENWLFCVSVRSELNDRLGMRGIGAVVLPVRGPPAQLTAW